MASESEILFEKFGREFPAGTVIFREGDVGNEMYVIQSGKVNITKEVRGVEKVLVTLGPGAFFGEMAIINQKPRSANAVVVEDARLLVIGPKTFDTMIRSNVEIAVRMIKILAQRLQEAD
ncbi:MAG: cyclic nucleotide-binding domain-containing protein, partial [Deltaproteobacteria bacterium]